MSSPSVASSENLLNSYVDCPLCAQNNAKALDEYSLPPWQIVECLNCSFVYLANPPAYESLSEDQAWEKNFKKEAVRRRTDRPVVDKLSKSTRWRLNLLGTDKRQRLLKVFKRGRVLDIGCGAGNMLPEPLIPYGIEISKKLARQANKRMKGRGGRCIHAPALEGLKTFEDGYFDGVLLNSFLEHEAKPLPVLHEVFRVLSNEGVAYVRVPNFSALNRRIRGQKWCGFRYPDHVNYFDAESLTKMANLAGFEVKILNPIGLPFDDNVKAMLFKA